MSMSLFTSMSVKASDEKTMAIAISPLQAIFLKTLQMRRSVLLASPLATSIRATSSAMASRAWCR